MHPGHIPTERGSTTLYYSILNRKMCSVTAFLMSDIIDKGVNLNIENYQIPSKNMNVDLWYDNIVRADCFVKTIDMIINNKVQEKVVQENGEEFFVIHPVLKHISLLSLT
jgi:methionyl-tRNA formyltransferase